MPSTAIYSQKALTDLEEIDAYIAARDGEGRATAFRMYIDRTAENLAFMPGIGRRHAYLDEGTLAFPAPPWVIYYARREDGIEVLRVIDGRRDLPSVFKKKSPRRR